jgi:hypothetical protein
MTSIAFIAFVTSSLSVLPYEIIRELFKLFPCLIKCNINMCGGRGDIAPPFFTSALDEGECSVSRPGLFTDGERAAMYRSLDGLQTRSGNCEVEKTRFPCRESNNGRPTHSHTDASRIYEAVLMNDYVRELYETLSTPSSLGWNQAPISSTTHAFLLTSHS